MRLLFVTTAFALLSSSACGGVPFVADNDAGSDGGTSRGGSNDGAPGASTGSLACGTAKCSLSTDVCCVYPARQPPPDFTYTCGNSCAPDPNAGGNPVTLGCTGASACATGQVCCIWSTGSAIAAACKAACIGNDAQLCDPSAAQPGCGGGQACSAVAIADWKLPPSFGTCGGKGN